ncbi:unnamed protein product [Arabis nemorensis]|uniref:Uncharacterized protein n=1 Tax=Arabis nemorensis TaxID=586526 RepID=A0A565BCK6_9BRAS|nr:unnamed protein product [Arabis nemorensis]
MMERPSSVNEPPKRSSIEELGVVIYGTKCERVHIWQVYKQENPHDPVVFGAREDTINPKGDSLAEEELAEAFGEMSLDQTTSPGITSSFSGQEAPRSQEKTLELQESSEQDQHMKELQEIDRTAQDGLQEDFYTKKHVEKRVEHEMDQVAPIRLKQYPGSNSPSNG